MISKPYYLLLFFFLLLYCTTCTYHQRFAGESDLEKKHINGLVESYQEEHFNDSLKAQKFGEKHSRDAALFRYNKGGNETYSKGAFSLDSEVKTLYDAAGNIVLKTFWFSEELSSKQVYTHTKSGTVTAIALYSSDNELIEVDTVRKNKQGQVLRVEYYNKSRQRRRLDHPYLTIYHYNEQGNLKEVVKYDKKNLLIGKITYAYSKSGVLLSESYKLRGRFMYKKKYNSKGLLSDKREIEWFRNAQDQYIKNIETLTNYRYKYDHMNNWTACYLNVENRFTKDTLKRFYVMRRSYKYR